MHNQRTVKLPDEIREYFRRQGSRGGKKRKRNISPEKRRAIARKAAQARWRKAQNSDPGRNDAKTGGIR